MELLRVQDLPRAASWPSQDVYEAIKTSFADLRDHVKKHVGPALACGDPESLIATAGRSLQFARLALVVRREHERLKRRRRGLDFDDLLVLARDLLRHHPELAVPEAAAAGATAIEFVLVDEFQDTDGIQGEILRLAERRGVPDRPAVRRRRHEAVDLPVPRRGAGHLPRLAF